MDSFTNFVVSLPQFVDWQLALLMIVCLLVPLNDCTQCRLFMQPALQKIHLKNHKNRWCASSTARIKTEKGEPARARAALILFAFLLVRYVVLIAHRALGCLLYDLPTADFVLSLSLFGLVVYQ
jgi:hypothetical protein